MSGLGLETKKQGNKENSNSTIKKRRERLHMESKIKRYGGKGVGCRKEHGVRGSSIKKGDIKQVKRKAILNSFCPGKDTQKGQRAGDGARARGESLPGPGPITGTD